jgi:hypothetical protein
VGTDAAQLVGAQEVTQAEGVVVVAAPHG